jgi:AcrR family transcriptional regulator
MPDLARAADCAVGTLYRIAPSKTVLANLLEERARALFEAAIFAPFPARLSLQDRYDLMWARLTAFALQEPDIASFLARSPMPPTSAFIKASAVFARDGAALGVFAPLNGEELAALVWGPLSALLRNRQCSAQSLGRIGHAIWGSLCHHQ